MKKTILDCEQPLFKEPPKDVSSKYSYNVVPPRADLLDQDTWKEKRQPLKPKQIKRQAFMVCQMIAAVNEAARYHKTKACGTSGNFNETWNIYEDPTDH